MTFDPDNPSNHKPAPKHKAVPKKARNEWWKVTGAVYNGPLRPFKLYKEGKCLTWLMHDE